MTLKTVKFFQFKSDRLISSRVWKISKKIWIIISSTIMIILLSFLAYAAIQNVKFIDNQFGESVKEYSSFWTGKCLIDTKTGKKLVKELDWIVEVPQYDSITVFSSKGRRGYVNVNTGKLVTTPIFDKAWTFSEGLAAVMLNNRVMFINPDGDFAFPEMYKPYYNDVRFKSGFCIIRNQDDKAGIIGKNGKWIVEPVYDELDYTSLHGWFNAVKDNVRTDLHLIDGDVAYSEYPENIEFVADTIIVERNGIERFVKIK